MLTTLLTSQLFVWLGYTRERLVAPFVSLSRILMKSARFRKANAIALCPPLIFLALSVRVRSTRQAYLKAPVRLYLSIYLSTRDFALRFEGAMASR